MKEGWLVNDCLTCIPGTRTFWHDLLGSIPSLRDMTGGYTGYETLADVIERHAEENGSPEFIIRNATYFRRLNIRTKTFSLYQDLRFDDVSQHDVCKHSDAVVFNSSYAQSLAPKGGRRRYVIPLGIDFDFFTKAGVRREYDILPESILFIGSTNLIKGYDLLLDIIEKTKHNFCVVMKDSLPVKINNPRVRIFNRLSAEQIRDVMNSCKLLLCTSVLVQPDVEFRRAGVCELSMD